MFSSLKLTWSLCGGNGGDWDALLGRVLPYLTCIRDETDLEPSVLGDVAGAAAGCGEDVKRLRSALDQVVANCLQAAAEPLATFSVDEFESEAEAVRLLVATVNALACAGAIRVWEEVPVAGTRDGDPILSRLGQLIRGDDTTLSQIHDKLGREFGADVASD